MTEPTKPRKIITVGMDRLNREKNDSPRGGDNLRQERPDEPSPWLTQPEDKFQPDRAASFVEYLRWMRPSGSQDKDLSKVQILQMAEQNANYTERLKILNERTRLMAGENAFEVTCSWRIRVGGHKGPESMLLPAFDALGMPYIPSSSLRGVARNQAIWEKMAQENLSWKDANRTVAEWFGHLDAKGVDRTGKIIFLDAYPLAETKSGGLAVDIATSIWRWEGEEIPKYDDAKPNSFLSLKKPKFLIGIRPTLACDEATLQKVKGWLVRGLASGVGSQVNAGYGALIQQTTEVNSLELLRVSFKLEGQLIHGVQKLIFDKQGRLKGQAIAEVRPIAFKSMLRYWFRVFALGVLNVKDVKEWESIFFGAINPQNYGWLSLQIIEGETSQDQSSKGQNGFGKQSGILVLRYSSEIASQRQASFKELMESLCWLMFHLGGVGQGARRPCYSRESRPKPPWWRGSTLIPDRTDDFWKLPDDLGNFQTKFCKHLESFYQALSQITNTEFHQEVTLTLGEVTTDRWIEAIDSNCQIIVCNGKNISHKPYALEKLHTMAYQGENNKGIMIYDSYLCGRITPQPVTPSPVWIRDLESYQVVTVFGANHASRSDYLKQLRSSAINFQELWPLPSHKL
jgi:CRISPR-associated protein Cmr6